MERYDEDIYDNPFFGTLTSKYTDLYEEATSKRWTLCVPKYSSVVKESSFSREDITEHIVLPLTDGGDEYKSWAEKKLKISKGYINVVGADAVPLKTVPILFEEIFYNNNNESFRVLCIGSLLNRSSTEPSDDQEEKVTKRPTNFEECKELLFGHPGGRKTQETLTKLLESFGASYMRLRGESFRSLVDAANAQFTKAMQTVLNDTNVRRSAQHSQADMDNLKVAVEMYIMHALHRHLFQTLTACVSSDDSEVNKMVRNSMDVKPGDLGIRSEFVQNIMSAKKELVRINKFSTPMGRLSCLKRVVTNLSKPRTKNGEINDAVMMTTDDFLPILILLVVKSEIPNWTANLMYMKYFHFSNTCEDDEYSFYLTTVEAALEHIRSGRLKEEAIKAYKVSEAADQKPTVGRQASGGTSIVDKFFQYVQYGDETAVTQMLRRPWDSQDQITAKLCHPLCGCDKCAKLSAQNRTDVNLVTAYTRDDRGYTALHIASLNGQAHLIDVLIQNGALVNASDYLSCTPLHLACQKGHQNIILLLVHFNADSTQTDGEGNTPLHLCVDNGHEDCVKAMVFLDINKTRLDINAQNVRGDTPLHLAAKWGYENIVSILLENDAQPSMRNRKKQTPYNIAQSSKVQELLKYAATLPRLEITRAKTKSMAEYTIITKKDVPMEAPPPQTPQTPAVASLDHLENCQLEKLYNSISDGDLQMVKFHLGWTDYDDEDFDESGVSRVELCHPLCHCSKCLPVQKMSSSGKNGIHINTQDKSGYSPLHRTVLCGNLEFVELFLRRGANVNCQTRKKITPLHLACFLMQNTIAKVLIQSGAKVNMCDQAGDSPVHICCGKGNLTLLDHLVQSSADINLPNLLGNTPLHIAVVQEKVDVVKRLVSLGAKVTTVNKDNHTPVQMAVKKPEIQSVLEACIPRQAQVLGPDGLPSPHHKLPVSIHDLFAAFEAKDLKMLDTVNQSIREFDARGSLRNTTVRDASDRAVTILRQQHSIKKFDLRGLRHVQSLDKSDPLHMYRLAISGEESGLRSVVHEPASGGLNDICPHEDTREDSSEIPTGVKDSHSHSVDISNSVISDNQKDVSDVLQVLKDKTLSKVDSTSSDLNTRSDNGRTLSDSQNSEGSCTSVSQALEHLSSDLDPHVVSADVVDSPHVHCTGSAQPQDTCDKVKGLDTNSSSLGDWDSSSEESEADIFEEMARNKLKASSLAN